MNPRRHGFGVVFALCCMARIFGGFGCYDDDLSVVKRFPIMSSRVSCKARRDEFRVQYVSRGTARGKCVISPAKECSEYILPFEANSRDHSDAP